MKISILGNKDSGAYNLALKTINELGYEHVNNLECDVAIAPLLTEIIHFSELNRPRHGTLIFHPSPLPYGRGAASIKFAYKRSEPITGATWFWANDGKVDSGDICEMEIVKIDHSQRPREFYNSHILPAMQRTLKRCLIGIEKGFIRRIPQVETYASFDYKSA